MLKLIVAAAALVATVVAANAMGGTLPASIVAPEPLAVPLWPAPVPAFRAQAPVKRHHHKAAPRNL